MANWNYETIPPQMGRNMMPREDSWSEMQSGQTMTMERNNRPIPMPEVMGSMNDMSMNQRLNGNWMNGGGMNGGGMNGNGMNGSGMNGSGMNGNGMWPSPDQLSEDMSNRLPDQIIENPQSASQDYMGSLKAMLRQNKGNYLVATFLVGTQNTVSWEGILYEVGNDYMTIYQPGRDRYIVSDIYSLKYMEFYDVQRRERCNQLLAEEEYPR